MKKMLLPAFLALIAGACCLAFMVTVPAVTPFTATQTLTANILPAAIVTPAMQATEMLATTQTFAAKQDAQPAVDAYGGVVVVIKPHSATTITATSMDTVGVGPQVTRLPIVLGSAIAVC